MDSLPSQGMTTFQKGHHQQHDGPDNERMAVAYAFTVLTGSLAMIAAAAVFNRSS